MHSFATSSQLTGGRHSIKLGSSSLVLEFEKNASSDVLLVSFAAAASDRSRITLPYFSGIPMLGPYQINKLFLSDPAFQLSQTINLGWYAGIPGEFACQELLTLISSVLKASQSQKLYFIGGSGGGFAALLYASFFPEALAFVWNPQTDIFNYDPGHLQNYLQLCAKHDPEGLYDLENARETLHRHGIHSSVIERYANQGTTTRVIYLQEESDWHVEKHLHPFLEALDLALDRRGHVRDNLYLVSSNINKVHGALPRELLTEASKIILHHPPDEFARAGELLKEVCRKYEEKQG